MSDEITHALLRKINDSIEKTNDRVEVLSGQAVMLNQHAAVTNDRLAVLTEHAEVTNQRLSLVEITLQGVAEQLVFIGRYMKNRHVAALTELRKRVAKLEKKVG